VQIISKSNHLYAAHCTAEQANSRHLNPHTHTYKIQQEGKMPIQYSNMHKIQQTLKNFRHQNSEVEVTRLTLTTGGA